MEEFYGHSSPWQHHIKSRDSSTPKTNTVDTTAYDNTNNDKDVNENHSSEEPGSATHDLKLEEDATIPNGTLSTVTPPSEELFTGLQSVTENTPTKPQRNPKKKPSKSSLRNTESVTIRQRLEALLAARDDHQFECLNLNFSESESSDTSEVMNSEGNTPTVPKTAFPSIEGLPNTSNQERELLARAVSCESPVSESMGVPFMCRTAMHRSVAETDRDEKELLQQMAFDLDNFDDDEDKPSEASLSESSKLLQNLVVIHKEGLNVLDSTADESLLGIAYPKDWDLSETYEIASMDNDTYDRLPDVREAFTELVLDTDDSASSDSLMQQQTREDSGIDLKTDNEKKDDSGPSGKNFDRGAACSGWIKPHKCVFLDMEEYWESDPAKNEKNPEDSETASHSWTDIDISQKILQRRKLSQHDRRRTRSSSPTTQDVIQECNQRLCLSDRYNYSEQGVFTCETNSKDITNGQAAEQIDRTKVTPDRTLNPHTPVIKVLTRKSKVNDRDETNQVPNQYSNGTHCAKDSLSIKSTQSDTSINDIESPSDDSTDINQEDFLSSLPTEITMKVFSYLTPKELLLYAAPVCKTWKEWAHDPILWQSLCVNANENIDSYDLCKIIRGATLLKHLSLRARDELNITEVKMITVHCTHLQSLDLGFCDNVNEKIIIAITQNCKNLETVNVEGCERITDKCMSYLASLPKLKSLNVSHCIKITDTGVNTLAILCTKLEEINIDGIPWITDNAVKLLANERKTQLKSVYLDGAEMTDMTVEYISKCKNLQVFSVSFAEQFTDRSLRDIQSLQKLKYLRLKRGIEYSDHCLTEMFLCPNLHQLTFLNLTECSELSDKALEHLAKGCRRLHYLALCWCWDITDIGLVFVIENCSEMETLDLLGLDKILGMCLMTIPESMPKLVFLDLRQCNRISDNMLTDLVVKKKDLTIINYYGDEVVPFPF